jgi:hypothetical protein
MSAARCANCRGLLPPWLAASDPASARCPNCGHVNDLSAAGTPSPTPAPVTAPKSTNTYSTLEGHGPMKSPALAKTMILGSAPQSGRPAPPAAPAPGAQKAEGPAKTLMLGPGAAPPAQPQRRIATLPQLGATPPPEGTPPPRPAPAPTPTPKLEAARPAAPPPALEGPTPEAASETDADISIEIDTPPPAPPSRTSMPSWVLPAGIEDEPSGAIATGGLLRSRTAKITAAAVGLAGVVVFAGVLIARGGKPHQASKHVEVKSAPVAHETMRAPVAPAPAAKEPVAPPTKAPPPRPIASAPPPARTPPRPAVKEKPPEPPRPRPIVAAPPEAPPAQRKVAVASAKHLAAAAPAPAREHGRSNPAGVPSEDDQRLAREAYARGNTQLFQGHVEDALGSFKESLRLDPRNPAAQRGLGLAYVQAGNAPQAVHFLKRYLKASPAASDRAQIEKRIEQLSAR